MCCPPLLWGEMIEIRDDRDRDPEMGRQGGDREMIGRYRGDREIGGQRDREEIGIYREGQGQGDGELERENQMKMDQKQMTK